MGFEIIVTIGDTVLPPSGPPHTVVNIPNQAYSHAATGGSITITNSNGIARVEQTPPIADGVNDALRLISLKITANNAQVSNFPITFLRRMTQGPNTPPNLWYVTNGTGTFDQALGSFIRWDQFVQNPVGAAYRPLGFKDHTPGTLAFNKKIDQNHQWVPPNMGGDRILKVTVVVSLANGKSLNIPNGVKIFSSLVPDPKIPTEGMTGRGTPEEPKEPIKKK